MQATQVCIMWRRIDQPGHEVMRFLASAEGARMEGHAAYREEGRTIGLRYVLEIQPDWTTRLAIIEGCFGGASFEHRIQRTGRGWLLDGEVQQGLNDIPHLDFGFTPATNMAQLRYAGIQVGGEQSFDVAWFDVGNARLERLGQSYRRTSALKYDYRSPQNGYAAILEFGQDGFTTVYPELWERVAP